MDKCLNWVTFKHRYGKKTDSDNDETIVHLNKKGYLVKETL